MPGLKKMGDYPSQISAKLYAATPKSVFAGIAAGIVVNGGASLGDADSADRYVAREWVLLFDQGCVESAPPKWVRELAVWNDEALL
jgi:hypothetical protein